MGYVDSDEDGGQNSDGVLGETSKGGGESMADFSEEEDETPEDWSKLEMPQAIISSLPSAMGSSRGAAGDGSDEGKAQREYNLTIPSTFDKLTMEDLLHTITNPKVRQSLKPIADNAPPKSSKSGEQGKLSAPLAMRQQDKLDQAAAYEKSKETLGRWTDTVKQNRQGDHLHSPLANAPNARLPWPKKITGLSTSESTPLTELEAVISGILKESNMASEKSIE